MSKIEVLSAVHGIAPRSDQLLQFGTDVERGRISKEAYEERIDEETANWLALQNEVGIDIQENGKLRWQDHLRPIVKATKGFAEDGDNAPVTHFAGDIDSAPVIRWDEDNRFYRQPTIVDRLRLDYDVADEVFGQLGENISLITPESFASLCNDQNPDFPAAGNVFQLYSELLFYLEQKGVKRVLLEDYSVASPNDPLGARAFESAKILAEWCPGLQIGILPAGKTSNPVPYSAHPENLELGVENGTLHHLAQHIPDYLRPDLSRRTIWQKVVDGDTTVSRVVEWSLDDLQALRPSRLILTHSLDLELLPLPYAQAKVKQLGYIASELSSRLEAEL